MDDRDLPWYMHALEPRCPECGGRLSTKRMRATETAPAERETTCVVCGWNESGKE